MNIHSMLIDKITANNPYEKLSKEINRILDVGSVILFGEQIDIRSLITQNLNESFYNINVLNMHDMATYE